MRASTPVPGFPVPGFPGAAFLALAILITPAGNAAQAQELLVMPYACSMAGGRPMLTRAPEQSYPIIGQHEQKTFTACSPANPRLCRTWTVHRFDLDCDGARVPWVSVVGAAAEQGDGRAWAEGGRLSVRMGWQWGMEPDDPCARGPGLDDRIGFGRMRRYCADRRAMMPPPVVEMPFGFAPMQGIDGIFVRSSTPSTSQAPSALPPISATPGPPRTARAEPPWPPRDTAPSDIPARAAPPPAASGPVLVPPQATEAPPRSQPAPQAAASQAAAQPVAPPAPQPAAPPAPQAKEPPAKAVPAPQAAVPPPAPKPASPPPAAAPSVPQGGPIVPKIINRPDPAPTADASAAATSALPKAEPAAEPSPKSGVAVAPREARQDPPADVKADAEREDASVTVSLLRAASSPVTGAIAVFAGLTFGLLTAFVVARRRERVRFAGAGPRDIGSVSMQGNGKPPKPALRLGFARGQVPPNAAASVMHRVPASGQAAPGSSDVPEAWGEDMPRTRADAMQVLGMGMTPHASDTALKKIVDGLRLTWHPDLAKDEADRQLREVRIKQINAAWEVIQGRRGEV